MAQLIEELFARRLGNAYLGQGNDGAVLPMPPGRLVMSTDAHVVSPLFFPGGDIGCLAVHGTINDVAVMGASRCTWRPASFSRKAFRSATWRASSNRWPRRRDAGVPVVTGDTKVVEQGKGDGVFITTTGVGVLPRGLTAGGRARPATGSSFPAASASTAWRSWRSAKASASMRTSFPTPRRCNGLIAAMLASGGAGLRCCAIRRAAAGHDAQRDRHASRASA
jgi:hydrogenase expression/formation protein HypE